MIQLWLGLLVCTVIILYSGTKLSKYGDIIAARSGMGRTWTGVVLIASVTSLPELITGIGSVTYADAPNIAIADVLGSCVFNMLILALLDAIQKPGPISARAHRGHVLSAGFSIVLLSIVALGIFAGSHTKPFGWIGPYTLLFIVIYFVAIKLVYAYEKRDVSSHLKELESSPAYADITLKEAMLKYAVNAAVVIVAAVFLPGIGKELAVATGLGETFVGNIFLAISTSLPEVTTSFAAVRMGAVDLAIGNLFGSNLFNILILAIDDFFFLKGPLLSAVEPNQVIPALSATAMTAVAIIGLTYRSQEKPLFLAWDSVCLIGLYLVNLMVLYMMR